jgi:16S rRNA pseudouridine516 synthase
MKLAQLLFTQGFGTRRECAALILAGQVAVAGRVIDDPQAELDAEGLVFSVHDQPWTYHEKALVMLHKPAGYECSLKPSAWPGVHTLLPLPLRRRGVQPVGRLDQDTTGLLLLTDDGALLHKLTSPKHHVPKVYEAQARHPVTQAQLDALQEGVVLDDDPKPVRAEAAVLRADGTLQLTLVQGKYHQVKRMIAAVGNRCERLHRSAFGALTLPEDLAPGQWRWIADANAIFGTSRP